MWHARTPSAVHYANRLFAHQSHYADRPTTVDTRESSPVKDRRSTNCATQPTLVAWHSWWRRTAEIDVTICGHGALPEVGLEHCLGNRSYIHKPIS